MYTAPDAFLDALASHGPHPELADQLQLFGQFVGSWDLDVTHYDRHGGERHVDGEWHFAWALEGRAVADVWICPSRNAPDRRGGETGITVRFPDPIAGTWRSTWIAPTYRDVFPFIGRPDGDAIVLEGRFTPDVTTRWTFFDITDSTFQWKAESRPDDDEEWRLEAHFAAKRRS